MVDTWLANQLFESISDSTQVIIVGDQDQLPSVGPGQVLADLLQIDNLPKVSLTKIFRQSEDSTIVTLANSPLISQRKRLTALTLRPMPTIFHRWFLKLSLPL